jgi:uncharacterized repeat protein (TIGR03803 family)
MARSTLIKSIKISSVLKAMLKAMMLFSVTLIFSSCLINAELRNPGAQTGSVPLNGSNNHPPIVTPQPLSIPVGETTLHSFLYQAAGIYGGTPRGGVILSESTLYGMTWAGGTSGLGTIYSVNTDSSNFTVLHTFAGGLTDGGTAFGELTLSGSTLYGMTSIGGANGDGIIFSIGTDGSHFTILYSFTNGADGANPFGSLAISGDTLYGMGGPGAGNGGSIFSIETTGSNFTVLHTFTGGVADGGSVALQSIVLSGGVLYGTTTDGGASNNGTVFKINPDGTGFALIYSFTGGADGAFPDSSVTVSGSILYGGVAGGGANSDGTLFSINTNGTNFQLLHTFTSGADGGDPTAALIVMGSTLYGATSQGGSNASGLTFSVATDGSGFTVLHNFDGHDGTNLRGDLLLSGSTLYGAASAGGAGGGVIYSMSTNGTGEVTITNFTTPANREGYQPQGDLLLDPSTNIIYGTTSTGGLGGSGTIFSMNPDGSAYTVLHSFAGGAADGASPYYSGLVLSGGTLYGMTPAGGAAGTGVIFSIDTDGSHFSLLHSFTGVGTDGASPYGSLIVSESMLYGLTSEGGSDSDGVIFSIASDGSNYNTLYSFSEVGNDGANPYGNLTLSGTTLYGMTSANGTFSNGTIFSIDIDGSGYNSLYSFTGGDDGGSPYATLVASGSKLYGSTYSGGANSDGVVFSFDTGTKLLNPVYAFTGAADGYSPGELTLSGNLLYGMTPYGGNNNAGNIFSLNTDGSNFNVLYSFVGATDGEAPGAGLIISGNALLGTASSGGASNQGTLFEFGL